MDSLKVEVEVEVDALENLKSEGRALSAKIARVRRLAEVVPEAVKGGPVPEEFIQGFALMIESLLAEEGA